MVIIEPGKENIRRITGLQSPREEVYRLNSYLIRNEELIHDTVSGALFRLSQEELRVIEELPGEYSPVMDELISHWLLVPEKRNDRTALEKLRGILERFEQRDGISAYTILPTTACNARCGYCYEKGSDIVSMPEDTARKTAEFIEQSHGAGKVSISWFGGEPLLGQDTVSLICSELIRRRIDFDSRIVTNGILFDASAAESAVNIWNLKNAQITLDGSREYYNKAKNYTGIDDDPFSRVMDNIGRLLDAGIRVVIRLNLGTDNFNSLSELIPFLARCFRGRRLAINAAMLYGVPGLERQKTELERLIDESGLKRTGFGSELVCLKTHNCMADSSGAVLIGPSGNISGCEHDIFGTSGGNIFSDRMRGAVPDKWKERENLPECGSCPLLPGCVRLKNCLAKGECTAGYRSGIQESIRKTMDKYALRVTEVQTR